MHGLTQFARTRPATFTPTCFPAWRTRQVRGVTLWNVAPTQEPVWSVEHRKGFLRVLSSAHGRAKGVDAGASKTCFTRVNCAHRATEIWRGWGWLERSISESCSCPHSPVRHGRERTSCTVPDNSDRITLHAAGILPFLTPPQWHLMNAPPGSRNRYASLLMEWGHRRAPKLPFLIVCHLLSLPNCLISVRTDRDGLSEKWEMSCFC